MTQGSEEERLQRALAGDRAALSALWDAERAWVAAVLWAHAPRGAEIEDLLQDVAVAFVQRLDQLRASSALRPWLRAIAINAVRSQQRRPGVRRQQPLPDRAEPSDPCCPIARSDARDELDRVLARVHALPVDLREALVLRAVRGLSQREVAAALGVPETTIETRLARARRLLRAVAAPESAGIRRATP